MNKSGTGSVGVNIVANFLGKGASGVLGLVFVPLYTRIIGIESLGILGLFASFQAALGILDLGLSSALNRELARTTGRATSLGEARDLVRTLEWIFWSMAVGIGLVFAALAPWVPEWVNAKALPPSTIAAAGVLLAAQLGIQFPQSLYSGGLQGLERQALLNGVTTAINVARHVGVFLPLIFIGADLRVFVSWQIGVTVLGVAALRYCLWRSLPEPAHRPRFSSSRLRQIRGFSAGVGATTLVTLPLTMLDKLLLSRMLPLEIYGYYMLAWQGASGLSVVVTPFFNAFFPRFSSMVSAPDGPHLLARMYAAACQLLAAVLVPLAVSLMVFCEPVTRLWLHSNGPQAVTLVTPLLTLLLMGSCFNGLMGLPYAVTLAKGKAQFGFYQNAVSLVIYLPMIYLLTERFGASGAAASWTILNGSYVFLSAFFLHKWFLEGQYRGWITNAVLVPSVVALAIALITRALVPWQAPVWVQAGAGLLSLALAIGALLGILPEARRFVAGQRFGRLRKPELAA